MLELSPARKNKVNLVDYNCQQDIENRILMSDFTALDVEILEEILFSSLKISYRKLSRNFDCTEEEFSQSIKTLSGAGLLAVQEDTILVDKEKRKYFEFQIARFSPDFKPDMEFLQGLLKKVPIHLLPIWYSIPRSSNNIFESIVEKYLLTPQIFQRYLMELNLGDPVLNSLIKDLFAAPDFKVSSSDLIAKYNLTRRDFEEMLLVLEFNFVCCLVYEKEDNHWLEFVAPFHEWHEYLRFLKATETPRIDAKETVVRPILADFAFVQDMGTLLGKALKKPISLSPQSILKELAPLCSLPLETPSQIEFAQSYLSQVIGKICLIRLGEQTDGQLQALEGASEWIEMTVENRALNLYRHPLNRILTQPIAPSLSSERYIREAEKSIKRVLHGQWVYFDEFLKGVYVPLNEESVVALKKTGKQWKYTLPSYGEEEKLLLKATLFEWLFETGIVSVGTCNGRDCFAATPHGRFFFEE